jgi:uncharacterized protein with PIN domain
MMGFDSSLFDHPDDWDMIRTALAEDRIILTRDTQVMKRRIITTGKVRALFITDDDPEKQIQQVIDSLELDCDMHPFTLCLECNQPLTPRLPDEVKDRVPPYVFQTQHEYVECLCCHRIYWRGTHWQGMRQQLARLKNNEDK